MAGESKSVFCVRNNLEKPAGEHQACPYCFGRKRELIESGDRKQFCDYDPERDPVSFGFPDDTARVLKG